MDYDHSGMISVDELKVAYKKLNPEINDDEIEEIIRRIDYDNNGEINYSEFLSGTINEEHLNESNLK
jgi:Ca2+-binding EF-hand superfamily protein